ncbi:MAG: hypothetical protein QM484_13025 [Woeseiaceae bacterium]
MRFLNILALSLISLNVTANEWSGNISIESRHFFKSGDSATQLSQYSSAALQAEWFHDWNNGKSSVTFTPFTRFDKEDEQRTHSDIRELNWMNVFDNAELSVGIKTVFWGVSESQHLVDVINQTDLVEGMDGEDKLGQPMLHYSMIKDWGITELFVLPYFRERTFSGLDGRLRTALIIDTNNPVYESSDKEKHIDYAVRWSNNIYDWDVGLSYFDGTNRDPSFKEGIDNNGNTVLRPVYNQMQQLGTDIQVTKEAWLWKLEAILRKQTSDTYLATTAGFEYSFYGVFESSSDLGIVFEYLYDDRNKQATTPFQNDFMLGLRWAKNDEQDTTVLIGVIADRESQERLYSIEGSRRMGESMKLTIEARMFDGLTNSNSLLYSFRNDSFIQMELAYYF